MADLVSLRGKQGKDLYLQKSCLNPSVFVISVNLKSDLVSETYKHTVYLYRTYKSQSVRDSNDLQVYAHIYLKTLT